MRALRQRRLGVFLFALLGAVAGTIAGFWVGRALQLRAARHELADYSYELTVHAEDMVADLNKVFRQLNASAQTFCSDNEILAMQAMTFRSRDLKDIGRTHEGKLYCSAFLGRLAKPYVEGTPTLVLPDGSHVYINVPIVLASFEGNHATVMELGDTDAVLSPMAFDRWERDNIRYTIFSANQVTGYVAPIEGVTLPVPHIHTMQDLLSKLNTHVDGVLYRSRCSEDFPVCSVVAEKIEDIWRGSRAMLLTFAAMGTFGGFSLGLALALLYAQKLSLANQLHRDIRRSSPRLRLVYQPIWDIQTYRCIGAEALIRWTDHSGNAVSPDVFVRIAEEKGFIAELTAFVVTKSIAEIAILLRKQPHLMLSINIAASDLQDGDLLRLLTRQVFLAGIDPGQIALELTERSTADLEVVCSGIERLRLEGFKVHIDDFGTGFSSLSYLDQLQVNAIKIDRSFTSAIGTEAVTAPILPQILSMAQSLGLHVIVEGVESAMQVRFLEATGKPLHVQGWYFGKPMAAESLASFSLSAEREERAEPEAVSQAF